jgi:hypothetical protein
VATATAITATTFTVVVTMVVIVAVTAAATVVTVIVVMAVRTVNVAVSQLFFGGFADCNHFNVELEVLASQHVVAINHNVVIFHFGDFYWNRTLVSFSQETHANLQFVNAHEHVFRNALHQVVIVLTVSIVCRDMHIKLVAGNVVFQRIFQTRNQGTMTVQVV